MANVSLPRETDILIANQKEWKEPGTSCYTKPYSYPVQLLICKFQSEALECFNKYSVGYTYFSLRIFQSRIKVPNNC